MTLAEELIAPPHPKPAARSRLDYLIDERHDGDAIRGALLNREWGHKQLAKKLSEFISPPISEALVRRWRDKNL